MFGRGICGLGFAFGQAVLYLSVLFATQNQLVEYKIDSLVLFPVFSLPLNRVEFPYMLSASILYRIMSSHSPILSHPSPRPRLSRP
jgi:hypothetical protein